MHPERSWARFYTVTLSYLGLITSALMLAAAGWLIARRLSPEPGERYWFFVAAVVAQLGSLSLVLSLFQALAPVPFLVAQALLVGLLWIALVRWGRREGQGGLLRVPAGLQLSGGASAAIQRMLRDPVSLALLFPIAGMVILCGAQQWLTPLIAFDDRMYHAPRAVYWVQAGSIFPFETHNDRQTVFPFAAELSFAWALLFVKEELPGRMAFWLAYPATAIGMYLVCRQARVPRRYALAAVLLFISTPAVLRWAPSLKSDAWQPLMVLGTAYFAMRACSSVWAARPATLHTRRWFGAGILFASALAVKTTSLALAPGLGVVVLARLHPKAVMRATGFLTAGAAAGLLLTGAASLAYWNLRDHGSALGPPSLAEEVGTQFSAIQLRTHAARVPIYLFELPEITEQLRQHILKHKQRAATAIGADHPLEGERAGAWPGAFEATLSPRARSYSIGGLLWLPLLAVGIVRVFREFLRRWPAWLRNRRPLLSPMSVLVVLQVPLLVAIVFGVRWMGGAPDRFWMAPYALAIPVMAYFFALWSRRWSMPGALAIVLLVWAVYPSLRERLITVERSIAHPAPHHRLDEPYQLVVPHLGPGDRVLLIAVQNSRDYALFRPRDGYSTRIIPWGKDEFDAQRLRERLERDQITHVLIANRRFVGLHWAGAIHTQPFDQWLDDHPDFEAIMLDPEDPEHLMRLYRRISGVADVP